MTQIVITAIGTIVEAHIELTSIERITKSPSLVKPKAERPLTM